MTKRLNTRISSLLCITLSVVMIIMGGEIKYGVTRGIEISLWTIIPTLFPFFILSDLWEASFYVKPDSKLSKIFKGLFGIPGCGISAFLSGILFGFPLGIKNACKLYEANLITKKQLTRLCGFSNNPSLAFVVSGIGLGLFGSINVGVRLFFSCLISAVICGAIFSAKEDNFDNSHIIFEQTFNLTDSVKRAGMTAITISSYIIFFSTILHPIMLIVKNHLYYCICASLLEICSAVEATGTADATYQIPIIGFALGFSGFSVHLQAFAFMPKEVSRMKYLFMKVIQGLICATISSIII